MTCVPEDIGVGAPRSGAGNLATGTRFLRTPGKCRFAAAPAKAGAYVGQQVVGIGFSRCVREAQVFWTLETPSDGVRGIRASLWHSDVTRFQQPEVALATLAYLRLMPCHASGVRVPE